MYVLYLFQWSSDTQNLESQSDRLVEESDKGDDQSGYGGGCSNDCHCLRLCWIRKRTVNSWNIIRRVNAATDTVKL